MRSLHVCGVDSVVTPASSKRVNWLALLVAFSLFVPSLCDGGIITLQNGTATFSQTGWSPDKAIDGDFDGGNGWGISPWPTSQAAVWETASDVSAPGLQFTMHMLHANPSHLIGSFRFSVTNDDRSLFADGLDNGGDVTANWVVLSSPGVVGPAGMTFTTLGDDSVLAGGTIAATGVYTVTYNNLLVSNITGVRLEVLEDASLPGSGPGFYDSIHAYEKGALCLTELEANAVPEPSTCAALLGMAVMALVGWRWRQRKGA